MPIRSRSTSASYRGVGPRRSSRYSLSSGIVWRSPKSRIHSQDHCRSAPAASGFHSAWSWRSFFPSRMRSEGFMRVGAGPVFASCCSSGLGRAVGSSRSGRGLCGVSGIGAWEGSHARGAGSAVSAGRTGGVSCRCAVGLGGRHVIVGGAVPCCWDW